MRTRIVNANVIDCLSPTPIENATVVIENQRIAAIASPRTTPGQTIEAAADDQVIDLQAPS